MLAGTRVQGVPQDGPSSLDNTDLLRFACAPSRGKEAPAGADTVCPKWGTAENCSATRRYIVLGTLLVPTAGCAGGARRGRTVAGGRAWQAGCGAFSLERCELRACWAPVPAVTALLRQLPGAGSRLLPAQFRLSFCRAPTHHPHQAGGCANATLTTPCTGAVLLCAAEVSLVQASCAPALHLPAKASRINARRRDGYALALLC